MARKNREPESWFAPAADLACPLCGRHIPKSQLDMHHLLPKLKGGKETTGLHRICHRQIHALFTEAELANHFSTVEALLQDAEIQKFVTWVKKKSPEFYETSRMSNRKR